MPDAAPSPAATPAWDEGIDRLDGKLLDLVAEARIDISDARVIRHLISAYRAKAPPRDPASTTAAATERSWARAVRPSAAPFGFGPGSQSPQEASDA